MDTKKEIERLIKRIKEKEIKLRELAKKIKEFGDRSRPPSGGFFELAYKSVHGIISA